MDDIVLPDEGTASTEAPRFQKVAIQATPVKDMNHPSGTNPSDYVKITFDRFVNLVANHSFYEVIERNKDEEVILTTNLLTDLANSQSILPKTKGPVLILGGFMVGILAAYFIFQ